MRCLLLIPVCLAFAAAHLLGLHAHLDPVGEGERYAHAHAIHEHGHDGFAENPLSADLHAQAHTHIHADDRDVADLPPSVAGKVAGFDTVVSLAPWYAVLIFVARPARRVRLPPLRPPSPGGIRPHFLPPSQAPPLAA